MRARGEHLLLAAILTGALLLRIPAIGWGLPPPLPEVVASDIRCSYAFDEDDLLTHVSFSNPAQLDFDPRLYVWGTLHLHVLQVVMEAAERLGMFGGPWRAAYYQMTPGAFERVYAAGRWISLVIGLGVCWLVFLAGKELESARAGLWAAALVAASPAHLLASVQVRVDLTMVALVTLAAWLGLRAQKGGRWPVSLWLGVACGLAVTAKYSAAFVVLPIAVIALWPRRPRLPAAGAVCLGLALGVVLGQPYLLFRWPEMVEQISRIVRINLNLPPGYRLPVPELFALHAERVARFLVGPVAGAVAAAGLWLMWRRRKAGDVLVAGAVAGTLLSWIPLAWPMLRYQVLALPFVALAAAVALVRCRPAWQWLLGGTALLFPLGASLAQLRYMTTPHPANEALAVILKTVPAGSPIARLAAELPPLDRKVYPMGPNPLLSDLRSSRPEWVLTSDLPEQPYPPATRHLLETGYQAVAEFGAPPVLAWTTLGESRAPHDWKYTHPRMVLYRRQGL